MKSSKFVPYHFRRMRNKSRLLGWMGLLAVSVFLVLMIMPSCFSELDKLENDTNGHYNEALGASSAEEMANQLSLAIQGFEAHGYTAPKELSQYQAEVVKAQSMDVHSQNSTVTNVRSAMIARWDHKVRLWDNELTFTSRGFASAVLIIVAIISAGFMVYHLWEPVIDTLYDAGSGISRRLKRLTRPKKDNKVPGG